MDTGDPDQCDELNEGFLSRVAQYSSALSGGDSTVHLQGLLQHDLRYLSHPFPNDTDVVRKIVSKQLQTIAKIL